VPAHPLGMKPISFETPLCGFKDAGLQPSSSFEMRPSAAPQDEAEPQTAASW
jgi:hypothetical protein